MFNRFIILPITTNCSGKYPLVWDKKLKILVFYDETLENYVQLYDLKVNVGKIETNIKYTGVLQYV
ncbi:unnamed protein product [marine sediment metagenome]|uniref:Uncharacterized protein n=1 Tax=marine sediment metagenome TaxID=412755 RepID=X1F818_9ZZZZ